MAEPTSVTLVGGRALRDRFKRLAVEHGREMEKALVASALDIRNEAIKSIQGGAKTGSVYKRGQKVHKASAAGEAPATDTGTLVSRIDHRFKRGREMVAIVGTEVAYGFWLEFGTVNMKARPWLQPAFDKTLKKNKARIGLVLRKASRKQ